MFINLMRLDIKDAWHSNAVVLAMLPMFAYLLSINVYRYIKYGKRKEPKYETVIEIIMIAVLVVFGIVRNIPGIL